MKKLILLAAIFLTTLAPVSKVKASIFPYSQTWFMLTAIPIMGGIALYGGDDEKKCRVVLCIDKIAGVAMMIGGVLLMDEESNQLNIGPITEDTARAAAMTSEELQAFNASIDEMNMIKNEILAEMVTTEDHTLEKANSLWNNHGDALDQDTFSALMKYRTYLGNKALNR